MIEYATSTSFLGQAVNSLVNELSSWSQVTFGTDRERGPLGPLKHLEKEAKEAQDATFFHAADIDKEGLLMELADCLILVLDASRRAGINPSQLVQAARHKVGINRKRTYPKPSGDEVSEHVRETDSANATPPQAL